MAVVITQLLFGIPDFFSPDTEQVDIISWQSDEKLCGISRYRARARCKKELLGAVKESQWCGRQAVLWINCLEDEKQHYRSIAGYIETVQTFEKVDGYAYIDLDMVSHPPSKFNYASALYADKSEYQIGKQIFEQSGGSVKHYCPEQGVRDCLAEVNIPRDCLLQYQESDIIFLQRIFWQRGLMYSIGLNANDAQQRHFPTKSLRPQLGLWTNFSQYAQGKPKRALQVSAQAVADTVGGREGVFNVRIIRQAVSSQAQGTGVDGQDVFQSEKYQILAAEQRSSDEYLRQHYGRYVGSPAVQGSSPVDVWYESSHKTKTYWDCDNPLLGLDRVVISGLPNKPSQSGRQNSTAGTEMCVIGLKQSFKRGTAGVWRCTGAAEAIDGKGKWLPEPPVAPRVPPVFQGIVVRTKEGERAMSVGMKPESDNRFRTDNYGRVDVRVLGLDARSPNGELSTGDGLAGVIRVRIATPMAGTGYGMYMGLPEGTEVAVGFVDGDAQPPSILGSFFGQKGEDVNANLIDSERPGDWKLSASGRATVKAIDELELKSGALDADENSRSAAKITLNKASESIELNSQKSISVNTLHVESISSPVSLKIGGMQMYGRGPFDDPGSWKYGGGPVTRYDYGHYDFMHFYLNFSCGVWVGAFLLFVVAFIFYELFYGLFQVTRGLTLLAFGYDYRILGASLATYQASQRHIVLTKYTANIVAEAVPVVAVSTDGVQFVSSTVDPIQEEEEPPEDYPPAPSDDQIAANNLISERNLQRRNYPAFPFG